MAENDSTELARKRVAEDKARTEESRKQYEERSKGKPTPTQEENDLAAHGAHLLEKEDDGSGPDVFSTMPLGGRKQDEAVKPAGQGYATRQATPRTPPKE